MSVHPTPTELGDFAFEVLERPGPNEWFALVTPEDEVQQVANALQGELLAIDEVELAHLHARTSDEIAGFVHSHRTGVLLLSGQDAFGPLEWQKLDGFRSLLQRDGASVFILGEAALGELFRHAPNLSSWLGGSVWRLERQDHTLSAREKQERLESLRQWSGMTDEDVITRAEQGTLPGDPPYAEWLVLLGRGELLGKH
jgi:hypothetical protein